VELVGQATRLTLAVLILEGRGPGLSLGVPGLHQGDRFFKDSVK
jgi:hypothetical protein